MTRDEAIDYLLDPIGKREKHDEAIRMAIEALEHKRGEWIQDKNVVMGEGYVWYCSECSWARFYGFNEPMHNYCPNCGSDMRGDEDE